MVERPSTPQNPSHVVGGFDFVAADLYLTKIDAGTAGVRSGEWVRRGHDIPDGLMQDVPVTDQSQGERLHRRELQTDLAALQKLGCELWIWLEHQTFHCGLAIELGQSWGAER